MFLGDLRGCDTLQAGALGIHLTKWQMLTISSKDTKVFAEAN